MLTQAAMPYREEKPLRVYPVRANRTALVIGGALAIVPLVWLGMRLSSLTTGWLSLMPALLLLVVGLVVAQAAQRDSIAGGVGEVRLFANRLEVPGTFSPAPIVLAFEDLDLRVTRFEGRLYFVTVNVVEIMHLSDGDAGRALSSATFTSLDAFQEAVADIEALRRGLPLPVHEDAPDEEPTRDAYDDQLDAELDAIDD